MMEFIRALEEDFPASIVMSAMARKIYYQVFDHEENIINDPDKEIISWTEMEYKLFRRLELTRYGDIISKGFSSVEQFIEVANMVLNRRKSRAGKSLENHLAAVFDVKAICQLCQRENESLKVDIKSPEERSYNMSKIRNKCTKPEMYIRSLLHRHGLRFKVNCAALPGKPDLFFSAKKVAVFVHGCYWHQHPGCKYAYLPKSNQSFWIQKLEGNRKRDEIVIKHLNGHGIRVLILWECTIKEMLKNDLYRVNVITEIIDFINKSNEIITNI